MAMEKPTKRMDIGQSNKFQEVKKRSEELKLLASRMSSESDIDFLQGIERSAFNLMQKARNGARKVEAISKQTKTRKLHSGDKKTSKFGRLVGKLGQIAGRETPKKAGEVFDDAAAPMVKQILETAKNVLVALDNAADHAEKGLERVQRNSIASCQKLKIQTKRILIERATSMATKIRTFAKQTYGGFMPQEQLDSMIDKQVYGDPTTETPGLLEKVSKTLAKMDDSESGDFYIKDEEYDERPVNDMKNQHDASRKALLASAIQQAIDMVGEEDARKYAIEVFGVKDTNLGFEEIQSRRELSIGSIFGAAKDAVTGAVGTAGKIGSEAIGEASKLVKNIAVGKDGESGLAGKNGLANNILNTAGDVANKMLDTAKGIGSSIFGSKGSES
jgi:hypothetical protein